MVPGADMDMSSKQPGQTLIKRNCYDQSLAPNYLVLYMTYMYMVETTPTEDNGLLGAP